MFTRGNVGRRECRVLLANKDKMLSHDTSLKTDLKLSRQIRFYSTLNADSSLLVHSDFVTSPSIYEKYNRKLTRRNRIEEMS